MTGYVTIEKNQTLTHLKNLLIHWHFKLGQTGFFTVQCIIRQVWLVNLGENVGSNNVKIPKCEYFHDRKQEINLKSGTRQSNHKEVEVSLKNNQLEPGKLIFLTGVSQGFQG